MKTALQKIDGYKTYGVVIACFVYALLSLYFHTMTLNQAIQWFLGAAGLGAIRSALAKIEQATGEQS